MILFNLCGHGHFDMQAYDDYLNGRLPEVEFDQADEDAALAKLPGGPDPGLRPALVTAYGESLRRGAGTPRSSASVAACATSS